MEELEVGDLILICPPTGQRRLEYLKNITIWESSPFDDEDIILSHSYMFLSDLYHKIRHEGWKVKVVSKDYSQISKIMNGNAVMYLDCGEFQPVISTCCRDKVLAMANG